MKLFRTAIRIGSSKPAANAALDGGSRSDWPRTLWPLLSVQFPTFGDASLQRSPVRLSCAKISAAPRGRQR